MIGAERAAELLMSFGSVEIFTHAHPDGDTIGSSWALAEALRRVGIKARVVTLDALPSSFSHIYTEQDNDFIPKATVTVDVADRSLLGDSFPAEREVDLAIDHHINNRVGARFLFCDHTRAACGELIYDVIRALGVAIDRYLAECLYTAIATDTGCFKFSNTTRRTLELAACLTDHAPEGNFGYLNEPLFSTKSKKRIALEASLFSSIEYSLSGRVATVSVTRALMDRLGVNDDDLGGVEQLAKTPEGVVLGITLKERDGGFKVSLRSTEEIDSAAICAFFGGGGHRCAAGCFIKGDEAEAKRQLFALLEERGLL